MLNTYAIIFIISSLIIVSVAFSIISRRTSIPSVLLLMLTGVVLKQLSTRYGINIQQIQPAVEIFGAIGLVMIVLEGSLELHLSREKARIILTGFFSALSLLFISSFLISLTLYVWLKEPIIICFVYAIPLSVISSAILLPSITTVDEKRKEALTYEAIFSDILGILLFNFFVLNESITLSSFAFFALDLTSMMALSILFSFLLLLLLAKVNTEVKFSLLLAILIMLYSIGKIYHLSALMLILIFGIIFNNITYLKGKFSKNIDLAEILPAITQFKFMTAEASFFIRTFFFVLFGYSMKLDLLIEIEVMLIGAVVVMLLLAVRFCYFRYNLKIQSWVDLLIMPRGLVSIILFYNIPNKYKIIAFNEGILFFVIITTNLLMMAGLLIHKFRKPIP